MDKELPIILQPGVVAHETLPPHMNKHHPLLLVLENHPGPTAPDNHNLEAVPLSLATQRTVNEAAPFTEDFQLLTLPVVVDVLRLHVLEDGHPPCLLGVCSDLLEYLLQEHLPTLHRRVVQGLAEVVLLNHLRDETVPPPDDF
eukprot:CAMPEP_0170485908 /NCGR_PEP_ID=MMETSP0208-20121228/5056_1 /TAXON_ID=197538 /ORGANISM="Strombidium inclinatum, Strain S3" /LENGTH=142 /DNA_ID=CAMNT_0010759703 /DNA_START=1481 /DNA_END=1909 /DNA_ORIENTATION=-